MHLIFIAVLLLSGVTMFFCSPPVVAVTITDYTVTAIYAKDLTGLPSGHWAHYSSKCTPQSTTRIIPIVNSLNSVFVNISGSGMRAPFYAWNSTPLHLNSLGFLSPTWYGMCNGYCVRDFFAVLQGNYGFSNDASVFFDGGGDWPMISFYLAPFETDAIDPTRSYIVTWENDNCVRTAAAGGNRTAAGTTPPCTPVVTHTLVEYCNVPLRGTPSSAAGLTAQVVVYANGTIVMRYRTLPPADVLPAYVRSTGLIYSKTLRKVVLTPTADNGVVAYRFDPVYDVCDGAATATACTAVGADCVWCPSTSACASRALVSELCPRGQWAMTAGDAGADAQRFYNVTVDFGGAFDKSVTLRGFRTNLDGFPYFFVNPFTQTRLFNRSLVNLYCGMGLYCATYTPYASCNAINNTCPDGNFSRAMLALQSAMQWLPDAYVSSQSLTSRQRGDELCSEDRCEEGTIFLLRGSVATTTSTNSSVFTVQLYFDENGVVDVVVKNDMVHDGAPFLAYPPIRVGLVRYGVEDLSSVLVPQGLLRSGVHVRFVPQTACDDCGLHGTCDEATGRCGCMAGYYGADCKACPVCGGGSQCDDGVSGSGACTATCGDGCAGCSAVGGRCECGVCVCVDGWTGANCDVAPVDACRAYSFDGCAVCGQHAGCEFCFDSVCFNVSLRGTASGYVCSYSTPAADRRACRTYGEYGLTVDDAGSRDIAALIVLIIVVVVVFFVALRCGCWAFCRPRAANPAFALALGGEVTSRRSLTDRTVVKAAFVRNRVEEAPLMAVPLKQVSLKLLFRRRTSLGHKEEDA